MIDILIGSGEVGSALLAVLSERREFAVHDPPKGIEAKAGEYDWMHISMGWSDRFVAQVEAYYLQFQPKHIVIHSTCPVGSTRQIERTCDYTTSYYSPVRGRHPNLASAIRSFPKWYADSSPGQADNEIEAYYAQAGIQSRKAPSFEVLELMKLWETSSFALQLIMWAEIENELKTLPGNPKANLSAMKSWLWEKRRCYDGDIGLCPVLDLIPGKLGGHCLRSNIEIAKEYFHPSLYDWLTSVDDARSKD